LQQFRKTGNRDKIVSHRGGTCRGWCMGPICQHRGMKLCQKKVLRLAATKKFRTPDLRDRNKGLRPLCYSNEREQNRIPYFKLGRGRTFNWRNWTRASLSSCRQTKTRPAWGCKQRRGGACPWRCRGWGPGHQRRAPLVISEGKAAALDLVGQGLRCAAEADVERPGIRQRWCRRSL
jgi:hypothetical protein